MARVLDPFPRIFLLAALLVVYGAAAALGIAEAESFVVAICASFGVPLSVVWWIERDATQTHYRPAFHYGLYLLWFWPIAVPHYVLRTRGARGLPLAALLLMAISSPYIGWFVGYLLWPVVWGNPTE